MRKCLLFCQICEAFSFRDSDVNDSESDLQKLSIVGNASKISSLVKKTQFRLFLLLVCWFCAFTNFAAIWKDTVERLPRNTYSKEASSVRFWSHQNIANSILKTSQFPLPILQADFFVIAHNNIANKEKIFFQFKNKHDTYLNVLRY
jgi:hypothetical protein